MGACDEEQGGDCCTPLAAAARATEGSDREPVLSTRLRGRVDQVGERAICLREGERPFEGGGLGFRGRGAARPGPGDGTRLPPPLRDAHHTSGAIEYGRTASGSAG